MNQKIRRGFKLIPIRIKDREPFQNNESFYINCPSYRGIIDRDSRILSDDSLSLNYSVCNNVNENLLKIIRKKHNNLIKELKKGKKLENEIEEEEKKDNFHSKIYKKKDYQKSFNDFSSISTITLSQNINPTKKTVIYEKPEQDHIVIKTLENNDVLKIPINKRVYTRKELTGIVKIQNKFRGFKERDINQKLDRLRLGECAAELFCLLIDNIFIKAAKRKTFQKLFLVDENPDSRCRVVNELEFKDKIKIKLIKNYYCISGVKNKFSSKK